MKRILYIAIAAVFMLGALSCSPVLAPTDAIPEGMGKVSIQMRLPQKTDPTQPQSPARSLASALSGARGDLPEPTRAIGSSYSALSVTVLDGANVVTSQTSSNNGVSILVPAGTYTVKLDVYNYKMSSTVPMTSGSASGVTVTSGGSSTIGILCLPTDAAPLYEGIWTSKTAFGPYSPEASGNWTGTEVWYTCVPDDDAMTITTNGTGIVHYQVFYGDGWELWEGTVGEGVQGQSMYVLPGVRCWIALTSYSSTASGIAIKYDSMPPIAVTGATLSPSTAVAFPGTSVSMFGGVLPLNATNDGISWTVTGAAASLRIPNVAIWDDPTVLVQDRDAFAVSAGTATFTVTSSDGGYTADCSVTVLPAPAVQSWVSWSKTSPLAGGASALLAVSLPADKWCTDTADYKAVKWYSVSVAPGQDYWIYHDDHFSGSGTYSADCAVYAFHADGSTPYAWVDRGYYSPLLVQPTEGIVYIAVYANWIAGTFAVGVHKAP